MINYIDTYSLFLEKIKRSTQVSGILFVYKGKVLLCSAAKDPKEWSIPKGRVDPGESVLDAAIRETKEEVGIKVSPKNLIYGGSFEYISSGDEFKEFHYFIYKVKKLKDIGLKEEYIKKLRSNEIEEARFFKIKKAIQIIKRRQLRIIKI